MLVQSFVEKSKFRVRERHIRAPHGIDTVDPVEGNALMLDLNFDRIRMLFQPAEIVRYVFVIRSERQLCSEVQVNLAYRWFCKLSIEDTPAITLVE